MTQTMTRDSHGADVIASAGNHDEVELESVTDVETLQGMLERSEDLEFRRMVRAQLRKLKKEKQENGKNPGGSGGGGVGGSGGGSGQSGAVREQRFLPKNQTATEPADLKSLASNLRKDSSSLKSTTSAGGAESNRRGGGGGGGGGGGSHQFLETISKLKPTEASGSKKSSDAEEPEAKVVLRTSTRQTSQTSPAATAGKNGPPFDVSLKHVTPVNDGGRTPGSVLLRNRGNPTPRQALKHFKQMDNEALLRITGTTDPQEALKRNSRNLNFSPNNIKEQTLNWCKNRLFGYENVSVEDFSNSWSDGLAFCALASSFFPHAFDYDSLTPGDRRGNFQLAFDTLEREGGVVPLLEVDDMVRTRSPDWKCVFTYVNSIIGRMAEIRKEKQQQQQQQQQLEEEEVK